MIPLSFFLQILTESRCCAKATLKLAAPRDSVVLVFKVNRLMKRPSRPTANGRPSKNGKKKTTTHLDVKPKTMRATLGGVGAPSATAATRTECSTTIFFGAQTRTVEQNTRSTTTKKLPTSAVSVNCTLQLAIAEQWRTFLVSWKGDTGPSPYGLEPHPPLIPRTENYRVLLPGFPSARRLNRTSSYLVDGSFSDGPVWFYEDAHAVVLCVFLSSVVWHLPPTSIVGFPTFSYFFVLFLLSRFTQCHTQFSREVTMIT